MAKKDKKSKDDKYDERKARKSDKRDERLDYKKDKFAVLQEKPRPLKELLIALARALKWFAIAAAVGSIAYKFVF